MSGKFSGKASSILKPSTANRPTSMADFMGAEAPITEIQKSINTEIQKSVKSKVTTIRENFVLPEKLGRRLAAYAYHNRTKKNRVVIRALERFFEEENFTK